MPKVSKSVKIKKLICLLSFSPGLRADLFDVYDLAQLRDSFPQDILAIVADHLAASFTVEFLPRLRTNVEWRLTNRYLRSSVYLDFEHTSPAKTKLFVRQELPHALSILHEDKQLGLQIRIGKIEYPIGAEILEWHLSESNLEITVTLYEHIDIWEVHSLQIIHFNNYLPRKVTLEQLLFLLLLTQVHAYKTPIYLPELASLLKRKLSINRQNHSLSGVNTYLEDMLHSFGPCLEALLIKYYNIENIITRKQAKYLLKIIKRDKKCII